ncbi:hypothetical protein M3Y96_00414800 [Aphelenchoides besseyi]|nr:hypothetical protein M3Y96_00414800 [Aphelenchoides besseyi]
MVLRICGRSTFEVLIVVGLLSNGILAGPVGRAKRQSCGGAQQCCCQPIQQPKCMCVPVQAQDPCCPPPPTCVCVPIQPAQDPCCCQQDQGNGGCLQVTIQAQLKPQQQQNPCCDPCQQQSNPCQQCQVNNQPQCMCVPVQSDPCCPPKCQCIPVQQQNPCCPQNNQQSQCQCIPVQQDPCCNQNNQIQQMQQPACVCTPVQQDPCCNQNQMQPQLQQPACQCTPIQQDPCCSNQNTQPACVCTPVQQDPCCGQNNQQGLTLQSITIQCANPQSGSGCPQMMPCQANNCQCPPGYVQCASQQCCLRYRYMTHRAKRALQRRRLLSKLNAS